ncbi:hypothetical protein DUNSADRAFT_13116 [Dunaliella salina]|uniref:Uncharacterized protein n=1 Tax=Dunaliella salina TaxID=3046 RepID=A0ABQ7GA07_DUNSA|nr:hypothetical protein DUNSADRAFT_13116 [Dunaliella salina]|eukprot:KAF5831441.1 hypothetical protein DUNSADRAFT_13116 [Dunaliella salina]
MEEAQQQRFSGRAHGGGTAGRENVTVMGKKSNLPSYHGSRHKTNDKPKRADNTGTSSKLASRSPQSGGNTAKGDQPSKGSREVPKRVSSSNGQGKSNPRVQADCNNLPAPSYLQQGVGVAASPGPKQQQDDKQGAESTSDAICAQESLTMPPLSLATPSHADNRSVPLHLQPHPTQQSLTGSPAKRASEYSSIGRLSEKRSRARGPSKEEEQVGAPPGPANEETSPGESGRPSSSNQDGEPHSAAPNNNGGSHEHMPGLGHLQSPSTPQAGLLGLHNHPDFAAAVEGQGAEQHRRVPRLNLDRLPSWAAHGSAGRPPCLHRPLNHGAQGYSPSPVKLEQQGEPEGGSEDDELASWMHEPQWVPDSEGKGHFFKPVSRKELRQYEALISELQPHQAQQVTQLWESLHEARQSCEQMTSRGVRAARDVTTGWAAHVSDLMDRSERFEKQVRELMLLTQHQADAIEALQVELAGVGVNRTSFGAAHQGSPPAVSPSAGPSHATPPSNTQGSPGMGSGMNGWDQMEGSPGKGRGESRWGQMDGSPKGSGKHGWDQMEGSAIGKKGRQQEWSDDAARVLRQELEASALENAKLASTNAELIQSLDSMNLLFSGAQAEVASLNKQLVRSQEQSASLERQLEALRKQQRFEHQHQSTTHHRYSQPAGPHASRPFAAQAFCAARASNSASRGPEQLHRHPASYMDHTSFRSSFGPDHVGLRSTVLGNEYKRAAFRAMLNRGGVV